MDSDIKLTVELVPSSSWYSNVRSNVTTKQWDIIRHTVYEKAGHKCEICDGVGTRHKVECHEVWEYDDFNCIQKLVRMIALCPTCHMVKHAGLAEVRGKLGVVINKLRKVNNWTEERATDYLTEVFAIWNKRNQIPLV